MEIKTLSNRELISLVIRKFSGHERLLTCPRIYIEMADGDLYSAVFLNQCVYWSDRGKHGWFYKSVNEWQTELGSGYTQYRVNKITEFWKDRFILETQLRKARGVPTQHYRVNVHAIAALILWVNEFGLSNFLIMDFEKFLQSDYEKISQSINIDYTKITPGSAGAPEVLTPKELGFGDPVPDSGKRGPKNAAEAKERIAAALARSQATQASGAPDLSWLSENVRHLAAAFIQAAGEQHRPVKDDRSKWRKILAQWTELGLTAEQIGEAVLEMRDKGLTIGGPESVTKTARDLPAKERQDEKSLLPLFSARRD